MTNVSTWHHGWDCSHKHWCLLCPLTEEDTRGKTSFARFSFPAPMTAGSDLPAVDHSPKTSFELLVIKWFLYGSEAVKRFTMFCLLKGNIYSEQHSKLALCLSSKNALISEVLRWQRNPPFNQVQGPSSTNIPQLSRPWARHCIPASSGLLLLEYPQW